MSGLLIELVARHSIAYEMDIVAGDRLLSVNGNILRDLIDYSYYTSSEEELLLEVAKCDGELWDVQIERSPEEPIGLTFSAPIPARCANNCLFCFVHQLPKGLRKQLYVKDEDYRLSFLNGNYVTLANLKSSELKRIVKQHLSPLYISVHTVNPGLREHLLGKSGIPAIMGQLKSLADAGIVMHTQIVLCPGLNDGEELRRTLAELTSLFPAVESIAIVPLGLTTHRAGLPQLESVTADYARKFVLSYQEEATKLRNKYKKTLLYIADEFYLKASMPFPAIKEYGDFPQIENGVGMVPLFLREAARLLRKTGVLGNFKATVVTGVSSFPFVSDFLAALSVKSGVEIQALAVENCLFGSTVTVSGLVGGNDIIASLDGVDIGCCLFLPDVMLKEGEGVFLDNVSLDELRTKICRHVAVFDSTPSGFYSELRSCFKLLK
ncbi:MAG: DUF512 domain-containing protein [Desulfuromonadaceae bacterium]|nr:DUF512 domain-containing protein [Desulfuromonadaceae bacterium]MDD2854786.1 DUF512 domain-containing protein [Desulfuromonadaceae bacterium]